MTTTRRRFLGATAALAGSLAIRATAAEVHPVKVGLIGAGWYGMVDAKAALKAGGVEIVAVCDVDADHLQASADEIEKLQGNRPGAFKHYEELLALPGLQAVIIGSPPQWHALQFLAALEKGLDIYCEKPLAYDVCEGRAMVEAAARRPKQIVQVGFQRRQSKAFQAVKQRIDAGELGKIVQVEAQIHYTAGTKDSTPQPPPASLDWDLWCGPAPKIPYSPQVGHINWRLEKTTGHGHLVDWGIHLIDACRVVLGLGVPSKATAAGSLHQLAGKITTPDTLTVCFDFDRCPLVWRHRIWGAEEFSPETANGVFFYGEKATVFATDDRYVLIPRGKGKERQEVKLPADLGQEHVNDFLRAVRTRKPPVCSVEDAWRSTATVQLAAIAYETESVVRWDAAAGKIVDNPAATALLKREYRAPYKHPYGDAPKT